MDKKGGSLLLLSNFLKTRESIREFKERGLNAETLDKIREYCNSLGEEGFQLQLYENGGEIYNSLKGLGGYTGVMVKSPHYIGLNILDDEDESMIYGAYHMEELITKLTELGIGSCWVSIKDVDDNIKKSALNIENGSVDYLIALGYPVAKNPFVTENNSSRLSVEEIVFSNQIGNPIQQRELEARGLDDLFYYIRYAPSSYNRQPWRFVLKDDKVVLLLAYSFDQELELVNAGIIMYYFENLAKRIGIHNKWKLIDDGGYQDDDYKYRYVGEFPL